MAFVQLLEGQCATSLLRDAPWGSSGQPGIYGFIQFLLLGTELLTALLHVTVPAHQSAYCKVWGVIIILANVHIELILCDMSLERFYVQEVT